MTKPKRIDHKQIWIEEWQKRNGSPPYQKRNGPNLGVKGSAGYYTLITATESERWPTKSEVCHLYSLCSGRYIFTHKELRSVHCGEHLRDDEQIQVNKGGYVHIEPTFGRQDTFDPLNLFGPDDANSNASSSSSTETEAANTVMFDPRCAERFDRAFFFGKKTSHVGINCTICSSSASKGYKNKQPRELAREKSNVNAIVQNLMICGLQANSDTTGNSGVLLDRFKKAVLIRLRDVGLYPVEYDDLDPIQRSTKINTYLEIMIEENVQYLEQNEFLEKITNEDDGQQYVNYVT